MSGPCQPPAQAAAQHLARGQLEADAIHQSASLFLFLLVLRANRVRLSGTLFHHDNSGSIQQHMQPHHCVPTTVARKMEGVPITAAAAGAVVAVRPCRVQVPRHVGHLAARGPLLGHRVLLALQAAVLALLGPPPLP